MDASKIRRERRLRRKTGVRKRVFGTSERPRLTVYRSLRHIYAQLIDDLEGHTIASASSLEQGLDPGSNQEAAGTVGQAIAERGKQAGVSRVAFDRNGFRYHGRLKSLADAAREGGLQF